MKTRINMKKCIWIILIITVASLILTGLILVGISRETNTKSDRYWFFAKSIETGQTVALNNAYILSSSNGELQFLHDNKFFRVDAELTDDISGVANIMVDGEKISKIALKPETTTGVLEAYTEDVISLSNIENSTNVKNIEKEKDIPIYRKENDSITQVNWNDFIIGISNISCVMENGKVCAIIVEEKAYPTDIRVVIKNGESIYYDSIKVKTNSDNKIYEINDLMQEKKAKTLEIYDKNGIYLCDKDGNSVKEVYEGSMRFIKTENGIVVVNKLPIENYLKYVVPSEMPSSFDKEALKCQAVCARTYAFSQIYSQKYAQFGANLDDSTDFQVYHNSGRTSQTDQAVEETEGIVITQDGELITSYYYSTNPKDETSPFYKWSANLGNVSDEAYGKLKTIEILEKNKDGYVTKLKLKYEKKDIEVTNEYTIRKTLGAFTNTLVLNNEEVRENANCLPSACFDVEHKNGEFIIHGKGYGHGIGMSQYGANEMATKGYRYKDIIKHYYKNIKVEKLK